MNEEEYTEYLCHQEKLKVLECHERELRDEIKRYEQEEHDRSKGMKTEKDLPITPEEVEYAELLTLIACE